MSRFFIVQRNSPVPQEWDPLIPDIALPRDCLYFGKVLNALDVRLTGICLHYYLTWDSERLPEYGDHVVVLLVGEEWGLIPRYARHVLLVAKVMSEFPFLGVRSWWPINALTLILLAKYVRNWSRHLQSRMRFCFPPAAWPAPIHKSARIVRIPWGSASLVEVEMKPIQEREQNFFFSGEISGGGAPKVYSRTALLTVMDKILARSPGLASSKAIEVHSSIGTSKLSDFDAYANKMMNSKICLAPRGSVADTWRFFEGLKSGCVVITNPLPNEWYYREAPVIQLDHWRDLENLLLPLLGDEKTLLDYHIRTLNYWRDVCGEDAVASFLAQILRGDAADKLQC